MINENSLKELRKHLPLKVKQILGNVYILTKDGERLFEKYYGFVEVEDLVEAMVETINMYAKKETPLDNDLKIIKEVRTNYPSSREMVLIDIAERAINKNIHLQEQLKKLNTQQEEIIEVKLDDLPLNFKSVIE